MCVLNKKHVEKYSAMLKKTKKKISNTKRDRPKNGREKEALINFLAKKIKNSPKKYFRNKKKQQIVILQKNINL